MSTFILTIIILGIGVLIGEFLWRKRILKGEYTRKLVHIFSGIVVGALPYFMSWRAVQVVATVGLLSIIVARKTKIIKSWYDIERSSWGDILGPASFIVFTLFEPSRLLFGFICLHVALSDGLAAIMGMKYGKSNSYKLFGYKKSVVGTLTFYLTTTGLLVALSIIGGDRVSVGWVAYLCLPLASTLVENIAFFGIDNTLILIVDIAILGVLKVIN